MVKNLNHYTFLVTGGSGFVGSHLVEFLLNKKARVITTYLDHDPKSYFAYKRLNKRAIMSHVDICNFDLVHDLVTKYNVYFIFHLAAQPIVEVAYINPRNTILTNVQGTVNMLECARTTAQVKGIIIASSDKAYGKLTKTKYLEQDALRGDHPYDVSKSAADLIAQAYRRTYNLSVVVTRFGNIYGEGDLNYSRIIPGIMRAILTSEPLQIRSDGKHIRDYLYVKDVVEGYYLLFENFSKVVGEAFNFGSVETLSVLEVVNLVEKTLKRKIPYEILNTAKNEASYQSLDYAKVKQIINWRPKYKMSRVIDNIYAYYKQIL